MQNDWSVFWSSFLDEKKLNTKVREIDRVRGDDPSRSRPIEEICRCIYNDYNYKKLNTIRKQLIEKVEGLSEVHLNTSRVKEIKSILYKIVSKKYAWSMDPDNRYSKLSSDNFEDVITDLVGIRFILSYKGSWKNIHTQITKLFPYLDDVDYLDYSDGALIPRRNDKNFIAEMPTAYYADGDNLDIYDGELVNKVLNVRGYRSVHYIVCFNGVYVELQVRTIFDEAWSDCDHNYVYKHEENASHSALVKLSDVLCRYTNACSELGELIHDVYNETSIIEKNKRFVASDDILSRIGLLVEKYNKAQDVIVELRDNMCKEGEQNNE